MGVKMMKTEWIRCPVCGNKTRDRGREDTALKNYLSSNYQTGSSVKLSTIYLRMTFLIPEPQKSFGIRLKPSFS